MILVDTSGWVGVMFPRDGNHLRAREAALALGGESHSTPVTTVAETAGLVRRRWGLSAERRFWDLFDAGQVDLLPVDAELMHEARTIDRRYSDLGLGFADSILLASCERERCARIFTFDRRLAAYKPSFAPSLELIP